MTNQIELTSADSKSLSPLISLVWLSPLAMGAASVANLALYAAAGALFPAVTAWPGAGVGQIIGATGAYLLIGTLVFALIARFAARPVRTYWIVATAALVLSMWMPISAGLGYTAPGVPPADLVTVITLCLMHVAAYAISVPLFVRQVAR